MPAKKNVKKKATKSTRKGKAARQPKTDHLKEFQWKPGQSGNLGGRPKSKPFTEAIQKAIDDNPKLLLDIARNLLKRAKKSDSSFATARDTLQGKPVQEVSGPEGGSIPVTVEGIDEALMKLFAAAQQRADESKPKK